MAASCVFCEIVAGRAPAKMVVEWSDAVAFVPLNPVVEGHTLVVPRVHVADATDSPNVTGQVMARAALGRLDLGFRRAAAVGWVPSRLAHPSQQRSSLIRSAQLSRSRPRARLL